ncbi:MAG TPA: ornithine cyclodeaminase family protein, partial [Casimicrobiaceae bacterium]|nr:ornithine cyclodeaminase family protein [Casimicrobiaceae bacterium]
MSTATTPLTLTYLNGPDVAALALTNDEILDAVEDGLRAQGQGRTVIEPRMHLLPRRD